MSATDDKEMYVERVRARLAYLATIFIIALATAIIFGSVPEKNMQMANSIIMFLLGMLGGGCMAYYYNAGPQSKKPGEPTDISTVTTTVSSTNNQTTP